MNPDNPKDPAIAYSESESSKDSFALTLDRACDRLWEKKRELSIRHICELERNLIDMEKELDELIAQGKGEAVSHAESPDSEIHK